METPGEEYSLKPLGETFVETLAALCKWAEEHREVEEATRAAYDIRSVEQRPDDEES